MERIHEVNYYEGGAYTGIQNLPISHEPMNFDIHPAHWMRVRFQRKLSANPFFKFKTSWSSFDRWQIRLEAIEEIQKNPRQLRDDDFEPILNEKQIDMKIGMEIVSLSIRKLVKKIILVTPDSDLIPAINFGRTENMFIILVTGAYPSIRPELVVACDEHRRVNLPSLFRA